GGNLRITSQNELILPMPAKWAQTARVALFYDMGGVYETGSRLQFFGPDNFTRADCAPGHNCYRFGGYSSLKRSVGVAVTWLAPIGLFRFSLGLPLNAKRGDPKGLTSWGDETEPFQFSVGQAF
ncbi:MAG TPA: BamA/TamA family outer membrane protein, partial [Steroidobacteraceae bacterium]|nr:BamA/TamA family outer membrane protein [Steroidobacteraceae bacterium]